ncbi:hypothetical protein BS47DRAFT_1346836 [Hydnum rufescens UP504]|uniref:Uncharacterized protein n=1 Tax=Hydnum rufescens UP504 TaxID=1448309 RepID=A0A9P6AT60_9AGAM|nr:hypothetical protein BS47DRAFT_1346836 [Hydnum rufescens UP504]
MSKVPILDGTPTAARLFALKSNLMSIQENTERWSHLGALGAYVKSEEIKVAISRHTDNLMDYFSTCQILTLISMVNFVESADASTLT